ncbi:non-ribosomal peptide synthetase [Dictyobacter arantiisoli]|uniref:Carrier domain-containing protein n=1 Tax=Dictyobacter arantiisoli TaxID=2014874 RepID=A0A5A5T7A8_9CHLR|nr:non-ribosomal peptide synthetase [Dictyobacter arantiisoli]GCF07287.1 hypothetical protein KDI_08510 [Dictyobacter arantiisoli]
METFQLHASPLSMQQARLWDFYQHTAIYHAVGVIELEGAVALDLLQEAIADIVARNEILRTAFSALPGMDVPMQIVSKPHYGYQVTSLEHLLPVDQDDFLKNIVLQLRTQPVAISQMPCLHCHLLTLNANQHFLVLSLPAFCADSKTLQLLTSALQQTYYGLLSPATSEHEEEDEPLQYIDVSAWQNELLAEEDAVEHSLFWKHLDLTLLDTFSMPGATAATEAAFRPEIYHIPFHASLMPTLEALALEFHASIDTLLLSVWYLFLASYTNQEEIIMGVGNDGRTYDELATALGLYTRFVPLPAVIDAEETFAHIVSQIGSTYKNAIEEQNYFSWAAHEHKQSQQLPVQYIYEQASSSYSHTNAEPVHFSLRASYQCSEPFLLKLEAVHTAESLKFQLHFAANRFTHEKIELLALAFQTILEDALSHPHLPVKNLHLLQPWQEKQLRTQFQGPIVQFPALHLVDLFEQQVARNASALAVRHNDSTLTYGELNHRANLAAHALRARGVGRNTVVGICVERSVDMIVGLLAILKAGAAYLALDAQLPLQRLQYQLQDAQVAMVVTQQKLSSLFLDYPVETCTLSTLYEHNVPGAAENVPAGIQLSDLAYVIYTSGSTGNPKGVLIEHQNVSNYIQGMQQQLAWQAGWQFATVSTLAADLGNTVIFGSLIAGGCLHILDYEIATSASRWSRYLQQHPIDVLKIVPSHMSALLSAETEVSANAFLPRQQLILGGEALKRTLLARLIEMQAGCQIINHYGPTETTIGVLVNHHVHIQEDEIIPLGKPLSNLSAVILNAGGNMVPVGAAGELYIAGAGLARGYLNQPDQTQAKFVLKRWSEQECVRYYRTGDLARATFDGTIEFLGRADTQVKIRGFRVELGEIEQTLQQWPQVQECIVLLDEAQPGEQRLVAYVIATQSSILVEKELKAFLQEHLPAYMVPNSIIQLAAFPLTLNGKIDRKQLPAQQPVSTGSSASVPTEKTYIRPRDHVEMRLATIWSKILNVHTIGVLDDFFDLGGNSIIAVRLMSLIHKEFHCDLALSTLFKHPTLGAFAHILREDGLEEISAIIVPLQTHGERLPFFCVHPSGGTVFRYQAFAQALGAEQPFYGLQSPEYEIGSLRLEDMAAQYVQAIQNIQPTGPYQIGGWSLGGVVAFEIAQQLTRQGESVSLLALFDSSLPPSCLLEPSARTPGIQLLDDRIVVNVLREEGVLSLSEEDVMRAEPQIQLIHAWEQARQTNLLPADIGFEQFRRLAYMNCRNLLAVKQYEPEVYPGRITFFRSSEVLQLQQSQPNALTGGWEQLCQQEIIAYVVPGKHSEMVDEPYVRELARFLTLSLGTQAQNLSAA